MIPVHDVDGHKCGYKVDGVGDHGGQQRGLHAHAHHLEDLWCELRQHIHGSDTRACAEAQSAAFRRRWRASTELLDGRSEAMHQE